ncbi:Uncharacterised protein [Mycobacteroides abscessus subsp. bolletii]|uniref:hypothetical protein n=1 Tax=Mycobacteroides abscessus TaxID=36809 RepID=UPI00092B92BE|nr:hypothetical protein [Mycobacteroides abscessus]SHO95765.1 Uncharacterised protein [Mycobacteroides abscessus subsp. bolletii]SHR40642.1 Uncharacterised protein [Mycobacteroides abscessus subsp. bolletii]SHR69026.1 Uncharacterised protein [Mycobacteroides abscessus subsp. bolletii]SHS28016.1 Uncharacterised protein [Mycobacteroides abscessus subsp. bolletii]SHX22674.1 Uncharacterised protein [Mycobacteroides abscessus subsp. bolletii]
MGFDELAGDDLVGWLGSWVDKVAGTVEIQCPPAASVGTVTVSVRGELQHLNLSAEAANVEPEALSRAIERAYASAYVEALRQLDIVYARVAADVSGDAVLAGRVRELRSQYADLAGLKKLIRPPKPTVKRPDVGADGQEWDPAADPLQRGR